MTAANVYFVYKELELIVDDLMHNSWKDSWIL